MNSYVVVGDGPELGVLQSGGGMLYDLLTRQEAHDIALVLNAGCAEEWEAVEAAVSGLVVVKA